MGRHRILSDEERKERKKAYDIEYQKTRYHSDRKYRETVKANSNNYYHSTAKKKENDARLKEH